METKNVKRIIAETGEGQYGFLPQRLDCVAALVPGIFTYEATEGGIKYIAIDEGILVKTGTDVMVSVRNAIGGADLGKLHGLVENEFKDNNDKEKHLRSVMAKMESSFLVSLQKFQKE